MYYSLKVLQVWFGQPLLECPQLLHPVLLVCNTESRREEERMKHDLIITANVRVHYGGHSFPTIAS